MWVYDGRWFDTYHEAVEACWREHPEMWDNDDYGDVDDYIEEVP